FVTAGERRHGHGRRLLSELERLAAGAGARRVRLLTTEALREALELYTAAGYREVEAFVRDGRRDAWLEKPLKGGWSGWGGGAARLKFCGSGVARAACAASGRRR